VNDFSRVISLGNNALEVAANTQNTGISIVLDRAWMTVASLLDPNHAFMFRQDWEGRIPTILCWSDLEVTLSRFGARTEPLESIDWHRYLSIYRNLAERCHCPILRTDVHSETECLQQLSRWIEQ